MRVLACSVGSPGFLYPIIGSCLELSARGHEVRVVTDRRLAGPLTAAGLTRIPRGAEDLPSFSLYRWFNPASIAIQAEHVAYALTRVAADIIVTSELALGTLIAAERAGLPVVVLGLMGYLWPADERLRAEPPPGCGQHQRWLFDRTMNAYNAGRALCGLAPRPGRCDDHQALIGDRYLIRNAAEFVPHADRLPERVAFVGPCRWEPDEPDRAELEWLARRDEAFVYVQLAANFDDSSLWSLVTTALADCPIAAVIELGRSRAIPPPGLPPRIRVVRSAGHNHFLAAARAVISHGTTSPTLGGLCHGLPSLLVPCGGEQDVVAEICRRAGLSVEPDHRTPPGRLLRRLMEDQDLHQRAALACGRLGTDSAGRAADQVEALTPAAAR
jgi:UDP:flavonoid glycosyltransferase YjiC (YdhE family)